MLSARFALGRALAAALLVAAPLALAPACRSVVAGDGVDAASELCDFLRRCYGEDAISGDCETFSSQLESASPEVRAAFLSELDLDACLASCPAALACLDTAPYCGSKACEADVDCCGWTAGTRACTDGRCCAPLGAACTEESECCEGGCAEGACGGRPCLPIGEPCDGNDSCCTEVCRDGVCDKKTCSFDGDTCQSVGDCCPPDPDTEKRCEMGRCITVGQMVCQDELQPCDLSAMSSLACCPGLICAADQKCREIGCAGIGQSCAALPCCGDAVCDQAIDPPVCTPPVVCFPEMSTCSFDFDCCSGFCQKADPEDLSGTCSLCQGFACGHDVCTIGTPLVPEACGNDIGNCVAAVTAYDSYCRCVGWDGLCISHLPMFCGFGCAN